MITVIINNCIIAQYNEKALYDALFQSMWQTLSKFSLNRKSLQGQLGVTAVLHTWGQTLTQHIAQDKEKQMQCCWRCPKCHHGILQLSGLMLPGADKCDIEYDKVVFRLTGS